MSNKVAHIILFSLVAVLFIIIIINCIRINDMIEEKDNNRVMINDLYDRFGVDVKDLNLNLN